jgi:hypothetical protein
LPQLLQSISSAPNVVRRQPRQPTPKRYAYPYLSQKASLIISARPFVLVTGKQVLQTRNNNRAKALSRLRVFPFRQEML